MYTLWVLDISFSLLNYHSLFFKEELNVKNQLMSWRL